MTVFAGPRHSYRTDVWGLPSQDPTYQAELVSRLRLPFAMISDQTFQLADALDPLTFHATGHGRLYTRALRRRSAQN